jgi:enoyl-CoA hydratase/carnithine racemase
MAYAEIQVEADGPVVAVALNRPAKRNALSLNLMKEMVDCLRSIGWDEKAKVVVLRGNGPVFSAGHDLREMAAGEIQEYRTIFATCMEMMLLLHEIPQPVIAQVHGIATAAGCQLVAACDLAVAAADTRFATPGVNIGFFCTTPMVALSRAVGRKKALEMLFTGEFISAQEALVHGLVNRVVPAGDLDATVTDLAKKIAQFSRTVLGSRWRSDWPTPTRAKLSQPTA